MHRTLPLLAVLAGAAAAQNVTLPDNHYLMENPTQVGNSGSTLWWRPASPSRFQLLYEASHFLGKAGVLGPVVITKIKFRGEDGEINLGGQVYTNVTVEVGTTSLTAAALSATFAANRTPTLPDTTTMGTLGTTNVTVAPSTGSIPNNWNIVLDLVAMGNTIIYDPAGAEPNLLIDVNMPTAPASPPPLGMIAMNNTTGSAAQIRGHGVTSTGAVTGSLNATPLVVGVEFFGTGGWASPVAATNEFYGGACGGAAASFFEGFLNGQAFDLGGGLTLTPDNPTAPNIYTVSSGTPAPDTTKTNLAPNQTLDDGIFSHALGFTFAYPTGSTSAIVASTNGYVWLDPAMTESGFAAVVSRLLGDPVPAATGPQYAGARLAIFWKDLNMQRNVGINPIAGLHVLTDASGGAGNNVCYVTWWDVGEFNTVSGAGVQGHTQWTFQMVLFEATGVVQFRYGNVPVYATASTTTIGCHATIVGFSPGRIGGVLGNNSVNPQNRDLSFEVPFTTMLEGAFGNMGQVAVTAPVVGGLQYGGRMFGGQTVTWNAVNVPPGTILGAQLVDVGATRPGLQFPGITAPGCMLSTTAGALLWELFVLPASPAIGTVPLVVPHGFEGAEIHAQFVALDGLFGGPSLITVSSNAIKHRIGLN